MSVHLEDVVFAASRVLLNVVYSKGVFEESFLEQDEFDFEKIELLCAEPKAHWEPSGVLFAAKKEAHRLVDLLKNDDIKYTLYNNESTQLLANTDRVKLISDILDAEVSWLFHISRIAKEEAYNIVRNERKIEEFCCCYDDLTDVENRIVEFIKNRNKTSHDDLKEHTNQISELFSTNTLLLEKLVGQFKDFPSFFNLVYEKRDMICESFGDEFYSRLVTENYYTFEDLKKKSTQHRSLNGILTVEDFKFSLPKSQKVEMRRDASNPYYVNKVFYSKKVLTDVKTCELYFNIVQEEFNRTGKFDMDTMRKLTDEPSGFKGNNGVLYRLKETSHIASFVNENSNFKVKEYFDLLDTYFSTMFHVARALQEEAYLLTKYQDRIDELKGKTTELKDYEVRAVKYLESKEELLKQYQQKRLDDLSEFFTVVRPLVSDLEITLN